MTSAPMFTAYFDAAGDPKSQPFVVVTGYIANFVQWRAMENMWTSIHEKYGVNKPFHMSDLIAATKRPEQYAKQRNARQDYVELAKDMKNAERFFRDICIAQFNQINCGISCIVPMEIYNSVCAEYELRDEYPPYALGARRCIAAIHEWEQQFDIKDPVEFIFEGGDFDQEKFTALMVKEGFGVPNYKPKDKYAGLQAADQYAWEQFHSLKMQLRGEAIPARDSFRLLLNTIPKMHSEATKDGLLGLCKAKGIQLRGINEAK